MFWYLNILKVEHSDRVTDVDTILAIWIEHDFGFVSVMMLINFVRQVYSDIWYTHNSRHGGWGSRCNLCQTKTFFKGCTWRSQKTFRGTWRFFVLRFKKFFSTRKEDNRWQTKSIALYSWLSLTYLLHSCSIILTYFFSYLLIQTNLSIHIGSWSL